MSKNFLSKFCIALALVAAAVMYLLSVIMPETFGFFNLAWAGLILCGGWGLVLLLTGVFQSNVGVIKKFKIIGGCALLVCALGCAIAAALVPEQWFWPLIAVVAAAAIMLGILATGGKKWDEGDNQQAGYKNYFERKKEEEENDNK